MKRLRLLVLAGCGGTVMHTLMAEPSIVNLLGGLFALVYIATSIIWPEMVEGRP